MYDRLLLPTGMSEGTGRAVEHAVDAAQRCDAAIHVLYVAERVVAMAERPVTVVKTPVD